MIDPGNVCSGGEQDLKLESPARAFNRKEARLEFAEPIGVKVDVLRFILKDERARFFQNGISRPCMKQPVICGADQLSDDEKLNFKFESEGAPDEPKQKMRPVLPNDSAPEAMDQSLEQARVFALFGDE